METNSLNNQRYRRYSKYLLIARLANTIYLDKSKVGDTFNLQLTANKYKYYIQSLASLVQKKYQISFKTNKLLQKG